MASSPNDSAPVERSTFEKSLVSVVIPSYNMARYLPLAIESVLTQTYSNLELIVVDDGSSDNTREVVQALADTRLRYVHQENKGLPAARNTGIRMARGEYVAFLDADDVFLKDKLKLQVAYLETRSEAGLVAAGYNQMDAQGVIFSVVRYENRTIRKEEMLRNGIFPVHSFLIRKHWLDKVGLYDETFRAAEDWELYCRLALHDCRMDLMEGVVCSYRYLPNSMSHDGERQTSFWIRVIEKTFSSPDCPDELKSLENEARCVQYLKGMARCYHAGAGESGKRLLAQAIDANESLLDGGYEEICDYLSGMILFPSDQTPEQFIRLVRDNSPDEITAKNALVSRLRSKILSSAFVRALGKREWKRFLKTGLQMAFTRPIVFTRLCAEMLRCKIDKHKAKEKEKE